MVFMHQHSVIGGEYKAEVEDAIPYNAALMTDVGLTVAVNSDDAEQARQLKPGSCKRNKVWWVNTSAGF